jgi:hypothetical protein
MAQRRTTTGARVDPEPRDLALELPPDRAFVLHLDARARSPRCMRGRVEHVASGRVVHVTSIRGVVAFIADVLRDAAPGE